VPQQPMLPRLTEGGTVICLASGPSLTVEDVEFARGKGVVIAVNDAVRLAPWADVIHSCDSTWWHKHHRAMRELPGLKVRVQSGSQTVTRKLLGPKYCAGCRKPLPTPQSSCWCKGIISLFNAGAKGISLEQDTVCTALNSGGSAINVAVQLGAKRIVLLGYDMGPDNKGRKHFYDTDSQTITSSFITFRKHIATMVEPLKALGIDVWNCSRRTNLEAFPCRPLRDVLEAVAA
jgi:hypothetical protein